MVKVTVVAVYDADEHIPSRNDVRVVQLTFPNTDAYLDWLGESENHGNNDLVTLMKAPTE
jgi:hypothetical protein